MLDNNTILRLGDKSIFPDRPTLNLAHAILVTDYDQWPCGTPVIFDRAVFKAMYTPAVNSFSLFPPRANIPVSHQDLNLSKEHFEITKLKPICRTYRTLEIEAFDVAKIKNINEYVKTMAGVSFVIKEKKYRQLLAKQLPHIFKPFKYSSLFYYDRFNRKWLDGEDDDFLAVISFVNLPYCVPIFNTKRVDGMGVSYCQAVRKGSEKRHNLLRSFRLDFVVSNYEENLFVIDGSIVNPVNLVSEAHYREVEKLAAEDLEVKTPEQITALSKPKDARMSEKGRYTLKGYSTVASASTATTQWVTSTAGWDNNTSND